MEATNNKQKGRYKMKNKIVEPITENYKIKIFKRNKEDKKMFLNFLRSDGEVFISVYKNPLTIKEDGTKIFNCEIDKKDITYICQITEKFHNWGVESELFIKE